MMLFNIKQCRNLNSVLSRSTLQKWLKKHKKLLIPNGSIRETVSNLTRLGCAWMDRAVLTDSTLKRNGSCPWNVSLTFDPRHPGKSAIHCPSVLWDILLSLMRASPLGWAPIQSLKENKEVMITIYMRTLYHRDRFSLLTSYLLACLLVTYWLFTSTYKAHILHP